MVKKKHLPPVYRPVKPFFPGFFIKGDIDQNVLDGMTNTFNYIFFLL